MHRAGNRGTVNPCSEPGRRRNSNMRRVSRPSCEEGPVLEEQETEGQRQLHGLLLRQLNTHTDVNRCVAKRQCFAPASLYRPFGEQAAGVRSLSQFQALQDGQKDLDALRELGLTDAEIQLWNSRDAPDANDKVSPAARQQRLQVIRDKMAAREELLSRPQRFAASRPLSRREMEIEQALFHGTSSDNPGGFLNALYHRDVEAQADHRGASAPTDPLDSLYRDVLASQGGSQSRGCKSQADQSEPTAVSLRSSSPREHHQSRSPHECPATAAADQSSGGADDGGAGQWKSPPGETTERLLGASSDRLDVRGDAEVEEEGRRPRPTLDASRPIGSLRAAGRAGPGGPLAVSGPMEAPADAEIAGNRASDEELRSIPRFRNYHPGQPSKVVCVKNISSQASLSQLVSLFSRFEAASGPPVVYRLLTGRMKGQAFVTLPDVHTAQRALQLLHGYRLLGKPLVIEFAKEKKENGEIKD